MGNKFPTNRPTVAFCILFAALCAPLFHTLPYFIAMFGGSGGASNGWATVFTNAVNVEAEGAKYFEGFITTKAKLTVQTEAAATVPSSSQTAQSVADAGAGADDDIGGFCQPTGLALFVKNVRDPSVHHDEIPLSQVHATELLTDASDDPEKNNMHRQICRAWLKHAYLNVGKACNNAKCERRHDLLNMTTGNLYKDYSFKGLPTGQRNAIIKQVQDAAAVQSGKAQHSSSCSCCRRSNSNDSNICSVVSSSSSKGTNGRGNVTDSSSDQDAPRSLSLTTSAPSVSASNSRKRSLQENETSAATRGGAPDAEGTSDEDEEDEGTTHRRWKPSRPWGPLHLDSKRWF